MSMLITCTSCQRHLRSDEQACPFCATPVAPSGSASVAPARVVRGTKRATLFAMGVSLAASACEADNSVAIYGAPPPAAGAAGRGNAGTAGKAGTAGTAGTSSEPADASAPRDAAPDGDAGDP